MEKLFWSQQGETSCSKHTPDRGSDAWVFDRWEKIPMDEMIELEKYFKERGITIGCETCNGSRLAQRVKQNA